MKGYWKDPARTQQALRGGWLHTGDLGRMDQDGFVYLMCRMGEELRDGTAWHFARQIEEALYEHPAVEHAAAIVFFDAQRRTRLKAYASLFDPASGVTERELLEFLTARLPAAVCPSTVEIVADMPRTGSGKLNRSALRAREEAAAEI